MPLSTTLVPVTSIVSRSSLASQSHNPYSMYFRRSARVGRGFGESGGGVGPAGQGEASDGMDSRQLKEAAARLEEVFAPAVKRLRVTQSTEVVLDSLFEGADDAGPFVVRFEVVITRCARPVAVGKAKIELRSIHHTVNVQDFVSNLYHEFEILTDALMLSTRYSITDASLSLPLTLGCVHPAELAIAKDVFCRICERIFPHARDCSAWTYNIVFVSGPGMMFRLCQLRVLIHLTQGCKTLKVQYPKSIHDRHDSHL